MNGNVTDRMCDDSASCSSEALVEQLLELIGDAEPVGKDERRTRTRFPIFCMLEMTPIDSNGRIVAQEVTPITGKDLSANGISFSHENLIHYRRIVVTLIHPRIKPFNVEAEITWTRQTPIGLYESGCRLIRKLIDPSAARR
jgi:hypothetical protein